MMQARPPNQTPLQELAHGIPSRRYVERQPVSTTASSVFVVEEHLQGSQLSQAVSRLPSLCSPSGANWLDVEDNDSSPVKRRKSLHGLQQAWGTVGKKFTLRGNRRSAPIPDSLSNLYREYEVDSPTDSVELVSLPKNSAERHSHIEHKEEEESMLFTGPSPTETVTHIISATTPAVIPEELHEQGCLSRACSPHTTCCDKAAEGPKQRLPSIRSLGPGYLNGQFRKSVRFSDSDHAVDARLEGAVGTPAASPQSSRCRWSVSPMSPEMTTSEDEAYGIAVTELLLSDATNLESVDIDTLYKRKAQLREARYRRLMGLGVQEVEDNFEDIELQREILHTCSKMLCNFRVRTAERSLIGKSLEQLDTTYNWTYAPSLSVRNTDRELVRGQFYLSHVRCFLTHYRTIK